MNYFSIVKAVQTQGEIITMIVLGVLVAVMFVAAVVVFIAYIVKHLFIGIETFSIRVFKPRLFFNHVYLKKRQLSPSLHGILASEFEFYKRLNARQQSYFVHRVQYYIGSWEFIGKDIEITDTMKVWTAATAAKLTFGLRDYKFALVDKIIIYPQSYYSTLNKRMHKGEFNMAYHALVFSWKDFELGYLDTTDNINLGVHEYMHALHFTFLKNRRKSASATLFLVAYDELVTYLSTHERVKTALIASGYFRAYAFENHFEFISVLAENFIETPAAFEDQFPVIYSKIKLMLNFNFKGY
ncbi:zinc-dependent peptidase [Lacinutrix undariae]